LSTLHNLSARGDLDDVVTLSAHLDRGFSVDPSHEYEANTPLVIAVTRSTAVTAQATESPCSKIRISCMTRFRSNMEGMGTRVAGEPLRIYIYRGLAEAADAAGLDYEGTSGKSEIYMIKSQLVY
jgi:hypothetical protein